MSAAAVVPIRASRGRNYRVPEADYRVRRGPDPEAQTFMRLPRSWLNLHRRTTGAVEDWLIAWIASEQTTSKVDRPRVPIVLDELAGIRGCTGAQMRNAFRHAKAAKFIGAQLVKGRYEGWIQPKKWPKADVFEPKRKPPASADQPITPVIGKEPDVAETKDRTAKSTCPFASSVDLAPGAATHPLSLPEPVHAVKVLQQLQASIRVEFRALQGTLEVRLRDAQPATPVIGAAAQLAENARLLREQTQDLLVRVCGRGLSQAEAGEFLRVARVPLAYAVAAILRRAERGKLTIPLLVQHADEVRRGYTPVRDPAPAAQPPPRAAPDLSREDLLAGRRRELAELEALRGPKRDRKAVRIAVLRREIEELSQRDG
jgi:hypothetical protein